MKAFVIKSIGTLFLIGLRVAPVHILKGFRHMWSKFLVLHAILALRETFLEDQRELTYDPCS